MTMTMTMEREQGTDASAPRLSVTVQAAELGQAFRNVAPFASSDTTLPALTGVNVRLSAGGRLTVEATDRYALAQVTLNLAACPSCGHDVVPGGCAANITTKTWSCSCQCQGNRASFAGEGSAYLTADVVKVLAGIKAKHDWELVTIAVAADGALTVGMPDTRVMTWPSADAWSYPDLDGLVSRFKPADRTDHAGYNPQILAKFAKVRESRDSKPPRLVLTFGEGNLSRFECGPVTGLICQWRDA